MSAAYEESYFYLKVDVQKELCLAMFLIIV